LKEEHAIDPSQDSDEKEDTTEYEEDRKKILEKIILNFRLL